MSPWTALTARQACCDLAEAGIPVILDVSKDGEHTIKIRVLDANYRVVDEDDTRFALAEANHNAKVAA